MKEAIVLETPYAGYSYAYPHKTAYRPLRPAVRLADAWASESRAGIFLYAHIPFCNRRCGFCNLFTSAKPERSLVPRYFDALKRQTESLSAIVPDYVIARLAIGGGTPTFLTSPELAALLALMRIHAPDRTVPVPFSVEVSAETADPDKLALMRSFGVDRISIGVQTFDDAEAERLGREQTAATVERAIALIRNAGFPTLNIDLIYGIPGQTPASWRQSLTKAISFAPEEIYLYPLYIRPGTGLARCGSAWPDIRSALYRTGVDALRNAGYTQDSMRMFHHDGERTCRLPAYCCQEDGMIGLGVGARSYTRRLHYSFPYAISPEGIERVIARFIAHRDFSVANYGILLDDDEQRRRYVIKSLLKCPGLNRHEYTERFGTDPVEDYPLVSRFAQEGWVTIDRDWIEITDAGFEFSDVIGPSLYSTKVRRRMESFRWR